MQYVCWWDYVYVGVFIWLCSKIGTRGSSGKASYWLLMIFPFCEEKTQNCPSHPPYTSIRLSARTKATVNRREISRNSSGKISRGKREMLTAQKWKVGKLSDDFDYIASVCWGRTFIKWEKSYLSENEMKSSFPFHLLLFRTQTMKVIKKIHILLCLCFSFFSFRKIEFCWTIHKIHEINEIFPGIFPFSHFDKNLFQLF